MVHLEELNKYNVWDIMELSVKEEQERFLASNVWSLVHAYVGNKTNGAVYPFGIYDDDTPVGFLMLAYDPHGKADYCWICYDRENTVARKLYLSFGFEEIGEDKDGDIDAVLKL